MLDAGRLKYVWTDVAEHLYQILLRFDEVDWRIHKEHSFMGYKTAYYAFIDGKPHRFCTDDGVLNSHPEAYVRADLLNKLQEKEPNLPQTPEGWHKEWWKRTSWEVE